MLSNFADSDVEELTEVDFLPEESGSLPSSEHTQFFIELCKLCIIISEWSDLLRPSGTRRESGRAIDRNTRALNLLAELQQWHQSIPTIIRHPKNLTGFSLWMAMLHIAYQAVRLRFCALLPESTIAMVKAAMEITNVCQNLDRQDLLGSLWNYGIHEFDLAIGQHARQANSKDGTIAAMGKRNLETCLPLLGNFPGAVLWLHKGKCFMRRWRRNGMLIKRAETRKVVLGAR
jgi:hypothetical protein